MSSKLQKARSATAPILGDDDTPRSVRSNLSKTTDPRLAVLEKQLARVEVERDDLARDVEFLCAQSSSSIFDSSMVLTERVLSSEKELRRVKALLLEVTEERDNLREDLKGHKDSKRSVDNSWKAERIRVEKLEKELEFYLTQMQRAMSDRDQMNWEAEELKKNALQLESRIRDAESQAETALTVQSELEGQLEEANARIANLEVKAKDCETIPGLWRHIEESNTQVTQLKAAQEGLQRNLSLTKNNHHEIKDQLISTQQKLASTERQLEETQSKAHVEGKKAAARIKALEARIADLEENSVALETRVEEAEGNLAAAQIEAETAIAELDRRVADLNADHSEALASLEATKESEVGSLQQELNATKAELRRVTEEFEQASSEKVQALMRVSQAEQTAEQAFEETGKMLDQVADLKDKVQKATQEKVSAVIQVASLKEQLRTGVRSPVSAAPQPAKSHGWRLWGHAAESPETKTADEGDPSPKKAEIVTEDKSLDDSRRIGVEGSPEETKSFLNGAQG